MADETRNPNRSNTEIADLHVTRLNESELAISPEVACAI